ncbi:MAG: AraC family transcriptional regulator [Bacteroidales bacterium]|nr:AraC family transcriptional regulator [Bacteroidales bacterium]
MNFIFAILIISGSVLGLFLSLAIGGTSFFRSKANTYLSISILLLTIIMFLGWLNPGTGVLNMIRAIMWELLVPITFLSYFLAHLNHPFLKSKGYKLFYLPFIISLVVDVILELDFSMNVYKLPITIDTPAVRIFFEIEFWLAFLLNIGSMLWALLLIMKSIIDTRVKRWLIILNLMLLSIIFLWLIQELLDLLSSTFSNQIIWVSISILLWFVLYYGIFKLQIAIERKEIREIIEKSKKTSAYQVTNKGNMKNDRQSKYTARLIKLMEQDKWYKNPLLSRLDIATELNISEGYLSQTVNQELGKSIIQLLNEYRINESKELLQNESYRKYSIEAIGLESGFKSKSVFYDAFKMSAGMSPGEFRNQYKTS